MIMYLMLSGYLPFTRKKSSTLANEIQHSQLEFPKAEWETVSNEAKVIVSMLLAKKQDDRPPADEVLTFPWLHECYGISKRQISLRSIENLRHFQCHTKIQQATLEYIVSHLATVNSVKELQETFMGMDTNGDGMLSSEEIIKVLNRDPSTPAMSGASEILRRCDSDQSGFIDYTEFLSASMDWKLFLCNERLEAAFRAFDLDGNGVIDVEELKEMISCMDETAYSSIMFQTDMNGDGGIDLQEFKEICLRMPMSLGVHSDI